MSQEKKNVYLSYEKISEWFDEHRSRELFEKSVLDRATDHLSPGAKILDIGCGMGEPIAQYLIQQGFDVTGIDGSQKLINMAEARLPTAKFLVTDMRTLDLPQKFDCIIAWHSCIHLSASDQRAMFKIFQKHAKVNTTLLFTSGPAAGEIWSDNGGQDLYHASLDPEEYQRLLQAHGFEVIDFNLDDTVCHASWWLAQVTK